MKQSPFYLPNLQILTGKEEKNWLFKHSHLLDCLAKRGFLGMADDAVVGLTQAGRSYLLQNFVNDGYLQELPGEGSFASLSLLELCDRFSAACGRFLSQPQRVIEARMRQGRKLGQLYFMAIIFGNECAITADGLRRSA